MVFFNPPAKKKLENLGFPKLVLGPTPWPWGPAGVGEFLGVGIFQGVGAKTGPGLFSLVLAPRLGGFNQNRPILGFRPAPGNQFQGVLGPGLVNSLKKGGLGFFFSPPPG
ncbi:hypothetical protein B4P02_27770 [Escherichia coli]|nr:hypothetical protein B4P02_27770 [Escherichia coli]